MFSDGFLGSHIFGEKKAAGAYRSGDCLGVSRVCFFIDLFVVQWQIQRRTTYKVSFLGEGPLWIFGFGVPSRPNPSSGALKSTLPVPREGSSILNADLVVVTAAVFHREGCVLSRPVLCTGVHHCVAVTIVIAADVYVGHYTLTASLISSGSLLSHALAASSS